MVNNDVLNPEDDPEIKYFKSFCKTLPLCYTLILTGLKYHAHVQKLCKKGERNIKLCQEDTKLTKKSVHCHLDHPTCHYTW